jgi:hypothetical protein
MIMSVCKYFSLANGCRRGDQCYYQHVQPPDQEDLDPARPPVASHAIIKGKPIRPAAMRLSGFSAPLAEVKCRFFDLGACRNGKDCRFLHNATGREEVVPEVAPPQARSGHIVPTFTNTYRRKRERGLQELPSQILETLGELSSDLALGELFSASNPPPPQPLGYKCVISLALGIHLRKPQLSNIPRRSPWSKLRRNCANSRSWTERWNVGRPSTRKQSRGGATSKLAI